MLLGVSSLTGPSPATPTYNIQKKCMITYLVRTTLLGYVKFSLPHSWNSSEKCYTWFMCHDKSLHHCLLPQWWIILLVFHTVQTGTPPIKLWHICCGKCTMWIDVYYLYYRTGGGNGVFFTRRQSDEKVAGFSNSSTKLIRNLAVVSLLNLGDICRQQCFRVTYQFTSRQGDCISIHG